MIIYKTVNLVNGKIYVGKDTKNNPNYLRSGKLLKQAIIKYGKDKFKKEILQECSSNEELNKAEIYWIEKLNALDKDIGYNLAVGGLGGKTTDRPWNYGLKLSPMTQEQKERQSKIMKEKYKNNEIENPMKGKTPWNKGIPTSEKTKERLRVANTGRKMSEETKQKISASNKGKNTYKRSEEHRKKLSLALKNRPLSEETKCKMSKVRKGKKQKVLTCPFCGKQGGTIMYRWHFDNCKEKK